MYFMQIIRMLGCKVPSCPQRLKESCNLQHDHHFYALVYSGAGLISPEESCSVAIYNGT